MSGFFRVVRTTSVFVSFLLDWKRAMGACASKGLLRHRRRRKNRHRYVIDDDDSSLYDACVGMSSPYVVTVVALFTFEPEETGDLGFNAGDRLVVGEDEWNSRANWMNAFNLRSRENGFIPQNYVRELEERLPLHPRGGRILAGGRLSLLERLGQRVVQNYGPQLVEVHRSDPVSDFVHYLGRDGFHLKKSITVQFVGEEGVDQGGPTRDLASSILRHLQHNQVLEGSPGTMCLSHSLGALSRQEYFRVGQLVAFVLCHASMACPLFSDSLVKLLCGEGGGGAGGGPDEGLTISSGGGGRGASEGTYRGVRRDRDSMVLPPLNQPESQSHPQRQPQSQAPETPQGSPETGRDTMWRTLEEHQEQQREQRQKVYQQRWQQQQQQQQQQQCVVPEMDDIPDVEFRQRLKEIAASDFPCSLAEEVAEEIGYYDPLHASKKITFVKAACQYYLYHRCRSEIEQFKAGLDQIGILDVLKKYPEQTRDLLCGSRVVALTADDVFNMFSVEWTDDTESALRQEEEVMCIEFRFFLQECATGDCQYSLSDVLFFVTGAKAIPPGGFSSHPTLRFERVAYPRVSTCTLELTLPLCLPAHKTLKDVMTMALSSPEFAVA